MAAPPARAERRAPEGWSEAQTLAGPNVGWVNVNFDLSDVYVLGDLSGQGQVWIGFYFYADNIIEYQGGAYLDDLHLTKKVDVQKPGRPKLKEPAKDSIVDTRRPTLKWDAKAGALTYHLLLRQGSTDGETVHDEDALTGTKFRVKKLDPGTVFYWRLQACNEAGCGKKTKWWSFSTPE
jgi:hypothetical protein